MGGDSKDNTTQAKPKSTLSRQGVFLFAMTSEGTESDIGKVRMYRIRSKLLEVVSSHLQW